MSKKTKKQKRTPKKDRFNPKWWRPTSRRFNGERFFSTGTRHEKKSEAQAYAKRMRQMGHKARVVPRKSMFGSKTEWTVVRDKY